MTDKPEDKTITREKKIHSIKKNGQQKSYPKGTADYGRFTFVDPTPAPTNNIRVLTNLAIRDNWIYAMWPNMSLLECSAIEEYPLISFRECCYALEYGLLGNLLPGGTRLHQSPLFSGM